MSGFIADQITIGRPIDPITDAWHDWVERCTSYCDQLEELGDELSDEEDDRLCVAFQDARDIIEAQRATTLGDIAIKLRLLLATAGNTEQSEAVTAAGYIDPDLFSDHQEIQMARLINDVERMSDNRNEDQ